MESNVNLLSHYSIEAGAFPEKKKPNILDFRPFHKGTAVFLTPTINRHVFVFYAIFYLHFPNKRYILIENKYKVKKYVDNISSYLFLRAQKE